MNPICPKCNITMELVREVPSLGALPILRTYRCSPCGYVYTEAEGFDDEQRALTLDLRADGEATVIAPLIAVCRLAFVPHECQK